MKTAILAGGRGSRLGTETRDKPKALVEIGGQPILWHIMSHYASYGLRDFVVALGYKGWEIKRSVLDYRRLNSDMRVNCCTGEMTVLRDGGTPWEVELVDTGSETATGGRIKRLAPYLASSTFALTWCDGLADLDLSALLAFHKSHRRLATVTAVHPPARFGVLSLNGDRVERFAEKPVAHEWINGAFFVLEPQVLDYIDGDDMAWEAEPLERLARDGELMAYRHNGFWQCMDTLEEKALLDELWQSGQAPWRGCA